MYFLALFLLLCSSFLVNGKHVSFRSNSSIQGKTDEPSDMNPYARKANKGEFPFMVAIYFKRYFYCGGSLITTTLVLTAANCIPEETSGHISELLGIVGNVDRIGPETKVQFSEVIVHPNASEAENDIAILRISQPVQVSDTIKPICLPKGEREFHNTVVDTAAWSSFSSRYVFDSNKVISKTLLTLKLQVPPQEKCNPFFDKNKIPKQGNICVQNYGYPDVYFGAGAGGGPLIYDDPTSKRFISYGVLAARVSKVEVGDEFLEPYVFTSTSFFYDWITEYAGKDDICFV